MTSTIEYSYLGNVFSLRVDEALMNRAVRVKVAVKEKLRRVFERNVVMVSSVEQGNINNEVAVANQSLVDLSEENLRSLNDKLNGMQSQNNVPYVVSRAVLFTKPLVAKIEGVTGKWFAGMPIVEKKIETSSVTNVVPGTWDDIPENTIEVPSVVPTEEASLEPVPTVNEIPSVEASEPVVESDSSQVEQESNVESSISTEPAVNEIPSFMPNMDELVPSVGETANDVSNEEVSQTSDFVLEPKLVNEVEQTEFVPEPVSLVNEEASLEVAEPVVIPANESSSEIEQNTPVAETDPVPSEEVNEQPEEKPMSVEEKIAEIIQRKRASHSEEENQKVTVVAEEEPNEEKDKKVREELKPELTQAGVIARLQRLNNAMKDKDATIRTLTAKNETAKEEVVQAKDKIRGYEAVITDLTARNDSLLKENEKLSSRVQEAETASQSTIAKLEAQVAELTEAKNQESEASKKIVSELKEKHASEIASLKEKHANELKAVSDSKERQIQAIYATISEALGDPVPEDDYGYSKAA